MADYVTDPSSYCRREAARLRDLAKQEGLLKARNELLDIAEKYEALARHYESARR